jgi:hypothetical protein
MNDKMPQPNPLREAYFGELHCHTAYSLDAYAIVALGNPDDAYRFAKGESLATIKGAAEPVRLTVPLDFCAVTDHSEWMGEMAMVINEEYASKDPKAEALLEAYRATQDMPDGSYKLMMGCILHGMFSPKPAHEVFGTADPEKFAKSLRSQWHYYVETAEKHYQPGKFTTFVGYEWSATPNGVNLHRNLIFRTLDVPEVPLSYIDTQNPEELWDWMERVGGGADKVLAIIHNSNASVGMMFLPQYRDGRPIDRAYAETRSRLEPLAEIHQIKGNSEANPLLATADEFANFEILPVKIQASAGLGGLNATTFVRDGLKEGLRQADRLGVNPFQYGFVGGTDNHSGIPGDTEEFDYNGSHAAIDNTPQKRLFGEAEGFATAHDLNPGGLTGVWAEENTRDGIFGALKRRETFGTSGVRIHPRFFGGWGFTAENAASDRFVEIGYGQGVPMGADLPPRPQGAGAPTFIVWAAKDPLSGNLDRIQIVKGWTLRGETFEKVYDVTWSGDRKPHPRTGKLPAVGNTVDLQTATYTNNIGTAELSATWTDPDFDPSLRTFYYARVLEIPTPRWSTFDAIRLGIDPPEPATVQERAWTSPIWYTPSEADRATGMATQQDVYTVEQLVAQGYKSLSDEELKALTVGKTLQTRNLVTGREAMIHYGEDGVRTIVLVGDRPAQSQYEIRDGKRYEETVQGVRMAVTVYKVGDRYLAAADHNAGYCNFEIVPEE